MAEKEKPAASTEEASAPEKKKGPPIKTIVVVLGLLIVEAVAVVGVVSISGSPSAVQGSDLDLTPQDELEMTTEVLIVQDKFPNNSTGRVWLWDMELQAQVKAKNREYVEKVLEERQAEIKTGVGRIIRNARQNHLQEPSLETLTRQLRQYLRGVFGQDPDGEERIQDVLLPKLVGFPVDF